ncbi:hypothetical protein [Nitrosomonas ureae]|uniref:Uncharacterized protein n=1 Tax=Nitrosomonas ureae TaxID=44577 RepID=A0A2T5ISP9_9PROT|nr:hypothetical protein [Nitrosomonas ureae]PTQ86871.1 hypothetical protein C8R28_100866 [Nitrosomonas ureae]
MIQIQATFAGYGGRACTLFSAMDTETNILVVAAEADYRTERRAGCVVLTNDPDIPRDSLFEDLDLKPAISAFYTLKSGIAADGKSSRLVISDRAARSNPEPSIEKDGIDNSGPVFRIADGVTCGQIAALATCLYAIRAGTIESTVSMSEELLALSRGQIITI